MDTSSTSNVENAERPCADGGLHAEARLPSMEKLESMVTAEQVHSASVAKKRRTITRKRTNELNKVRSQTPLRAQCPADETSTDDDADSSRTAERVRRPRTPDRLRKVKAPDNKGSDSANDDKQGEKRTASVGVGTKQDQSPDVETATTHDGKTNSNEDGKGQEEKGKEQKSAMITEADKPIELEKDPITGDVLKKKQPLKAAEGPQEEETADIPELHKQMKATQEAAAEEEEAAKANAEPEIILRIKPRKKRPDSGSASNSEIQSVTSEYSRHERASSIPKQLEEQIQKLDNFVTVNTQEFMHFLQKAKTTVEEKGKELRKRKFKKTDEIKRSQSQPRQMTEQDLLESFKRAQRATAEREQDRIRSSSARRYSSGSDKSPERSEPKRPVRKRVLVQDIIKEKKVEKSEKVEKTEGKKTQIKMKDKVKCNKIVEVLDPKTSKVIETRTVGEVARMRFFDSFKIFKYYSPRQIAREYRKYKVDKNDEYNLIRLQRRRCINHLLILIIFCGLGGFMFKFIEGAFENFYKCGVKRVKRDFIDLLWIKSHNLREEEWKSLARNRLRVFEEELHNAHEAGVHSYSGQRSWSFLNGIVYCLTVVTTIGYGHLYPTTKTGQALTIVYSLIGIPLFLIILTDFGKLFTRCIKFLWSFVRRLYYTGSCRQIRKTTHAQELFKGAQMMYEIATFRRPSAMDPNMMQSGLAASPHESVEGATAPPTPAISNFEIDDEFNLPISVAILLLVLYIFLGAVLFGIWEGWDFFASFYFVFISMSTIGFGDYVPRHPVFMIVSIVYLVFGLALMSMCINVVQVKISDTFNQASAKIGATIGLGVSSEDGSIKTIPPIQVEMPDVHGSASDVNTLSPNTSIKT